MDIPVTVHHSADERENRPHGETGEPKPLKGPDSPGGRTTLAIMVIAVIAAGIWLVSRNQGAPSLFGEKVARGPQATELAGLLSGAAESADSRAIAVQNGWIQNFTDIEFTHSGTLSDVSGGTAGGSVGMDVITGVYHLYAAFNDLPPLGEGFSYQGSLVRTNPLSVISTGKAVMHNNQYVNAYLSRTDLLDHDRYVLTVEPDDGNPAPASHILEGTISSNQ
ncbi:MAG: hypothetical protein HYS45_00315 [Parcubacteria group bacterium]|nr:hypothetical protein [Parcubacteria group bacterium]